MSEKPSYLGLLNAIALGEARAHTYLTAWADKSPSEEVACVLRTVAAREGEHGMSFAKRINELGFQVQERDDPDFDRRMAIASSDRTDLEKMEKFGYGKRPAADAPDFFDNIFKDHTIDIRTGELLGRYIAEERDSGRLLRSCYEQLAAGADVGAASNDRLAAIEEKLDAVCAAVGQLTSKSSNGSHKVKSKK
jgi:hypothetical protein